MSCRRALALISDCHSPRRAADQATLAGKSLHTPPSPFLYIYTASQHSARWNAQATHGLPTCTCTCTCTQDVLINPTAILHGLQSTRRRKFDYAWRHTVAYVLLFLIAAKPATAPALVQLQTGFSCKSTLSNARHDTTPLSSSRTPLPIQLASIVAYCSPSASPS